MLEFLTRRMLGAIATLLVVVTAVFFATRASGQAMDYLLPPGTDPAVVRAMVEQFGLDQPMWIQFVRYVQACFRAMLASACSSAARWSISTWSACRIR